MTGRSVTPNHLFKPPRLTADVAQAVDEYRRALVAERAAERQVEEIERTRGITLGWERARKAKEATAFARLDARMALDEVLLGEEG